MREKERGERDRETKEKKDFIKLAEIKHSKKQYAYVHILWYNVHV